MADVQNQMILRDPQLLFVFPMSQMGGQKANRRADSYWILFPITGVMVLPSTSFVFVVPETRRLTDGPP